MNNKYNSDNRIILSNNFKKLEETINNITTPSSALLELSDKIKSIQSKCNYPNVLNNISLATSQLNYSNAVINNLTKNIEMFSNNIKPYESVIKSLNYYENNINPFSDLFKNLDDINKNISIIKQNTFDLNNIEKMNKIIESSAVMTPSIRKLGESVNKLSNLTDKKFDWYVEMYKTLSVSAVDKNISEDKDNFYQNISKETSYLLRDKNKDEIDISNAISDKIIKIRVSCFSILSKIVSDDETLIKFTPNHYQYVSNLSSTIADDEEKFSMIVGSCYKLIYEGFGKDNLRTAKYIDFDATPFMITLKHLRLEYDHDIGHGDRNGIIKKRKQIKEAFNLLIGKEVAITSMDFKKAQLRLYELMEEWLIALLTKIIEKNNKELVNV